MISDNPILVTGATGNTGRPLVEALVRLGAPVRAMVRDRASQAKLPDGVQVAIADFDDPASLATALDGAGQAYLVTPSSEQAEAQQKRFADLAAAAGVRHLVVLSQLAAAEDSPVRFLRYHAAVERHVPRPGPRLHVPAAQPVLPGAARPGQADRRREPVLRPDRRRGGQRGRRAGHRRRGRGRAH